MRSLSRLDKPRILIDKEKEWLDALITSGKKRPDSSKYGNRKVLNELMNISSTKCYYCESLLKGVPSEIDHYIEVACDKMLSYQWENLYLSCSNCNSKTPHNIIPVSDALDPFLDSDEEIERHLVFDDELILPKNDSAKGRLTIRKFKLDSEYLDYLRLKELKKFSKLLQQFQKTAIAEKRELNKSELEVLQRFTYFESPYSLMFNSYLSEVLK
jgi:uncharacterized protein (TIGR02646 family)